MWRRREFGVAALRAGFIVLSVLWFGLSPAAALVLFLVEAWLYLTLRLAIDAAVHDAGIGANRMRRMLVALPARVATGASLFGVMVGVCGLAMCSIVYGSKSISELVTQLLGEPGLASGIGVILLVDSLEAWRYAATQLAGVNPLKNNVLLNLMRVFWLLLPAALLSKLRISAEFSAWIMLVAMVLSILFFEGLPTLAQRAIRAPRKNVA